MKLAALFVLVAFGFSSMAHASNSKGYFKCDFGSGHGLDRTMVLSLDNLETEKPVIRGSFQGEKEYTLKVHGEFVYNEALRGFKVKITNKYNVNSWAKCGVVQNIQDELTIAYPQTGSLKNSATKSTDATFKCEIGSEKGLLKGWGVGMSASELELPISKAGGSGLGKFDSKFSYNESKHGFTVDIMNPYDDVSWVSCGVVKDFSDPLPEL